MIFEGSEPDLTLEIESNIEHENENKILSTISGFTLTLIPSVEEKTYVQRVRVFGKDRSVLASDVFRARFVTYVGCSLWSVNYLLDLFVREKRNKITGDVAKREFSRDFYRQVRQLTFNAKIRSEILGITSSKKGEQKPIAKEVPEAKVIEPSQTDPAKEATEVLAKESEAPTNATPPLAEDPAN